MPSMNHMGLYVEQIYSPCPLLLAAYLCFRSSSIYCRAKAKFLAPKSS